MTNKYTNELQYNVSGRLKKVIKSMAKRYTVKVGILAEYNEPIGQDIDLAGLGAVQEFGADIKITPKMAGYLHFKAKELGLPEKEGKGDGFVHIPARSWLYDPVANGEVLKWIKEYVKDVNFFEEFAQDVDFKQLAKIIGEACLLQIQKAFQDSNNGEWKENSAFTIANKGSALPLVDKGHFRDRIMYSIEEK